MFGDGIFERVGVWVGRLKGGKSLVCDLEYMYGGMVSKKGNLGRFDQ